jgi:hypothetical protein
MSFTLMIKDGDSEIKAVIGKDGVILYKPTKSLTPALEAFAEGISGMASTKAGEELLLGHVRQAKDRVVLIGKDMCG